MMERSVLERELINIIANSSFRVTPQFLFRHFFSQLEISKAEISGTIKRLVQRGILEYSYLYGASYLNFAFNKPIKISDRILVSPLNLNVSIPLETKLVVLSRGVSFGYGSHPSTRMAVRMLDFLLDKPFLDTCLFSSALDIGTGSGILAIVAALLADLKVDAIDTDPCACSEAQQNTVQNHLGGKVTVSDIDFLTITKSYDLIIANLRYPTIKRYFEVIHQRLSDHGFCILSGLRAYEVSKLNAMMDLFCFRCLRREDEKGWVSLLLSRL